MKNFKYIKSLVCLALFTLVLTSCEGELESPVSNFVGFDINAPSAVAIPNNTTESIDIKVYATEVASSDRTFNIIENTDATDLASPYTLPSSVTIPGGTNEGTLTVTITDDANLEFVPQTLAFGFENTGSPQLSIEVTEECPGTVASFNLTLDTWPNETSWEVYDLNGGATVIASGGPYVNPDDDFAELSWDYCLVPGNYGVVVYDSYGDGGPTFSVTGPDGSFIVPETAVAGSQSSATFTIN
ncbi:MAG: hypothetical protein Wins2KO_23750 [Winogradskyella sp.]